jgi:hypothetical protein
LSVLKHPCGVFLGCFESVLFVTKQTKKPIQRISINKKKNE